MENNKKTRSIRIFFRFATIFPIAYFIFLFVTMTLLSYFYATTNNLVLLIIIIAYGGSMVAFYAVYTVYTVRQYNHIFISGLFNTTMRNFENITRNQRGFFEYPNKQYDEINILNAQIDTLRKELTGATLIPNVNNYEGVELDYIDKEMGLVTFESFKREISNIIFKSQNYRNIIIEAYYEIQDEVLTMSLVF